MTWPTREAVIAQAIEDHIENMRDYALPSLSYMDGYMHALLLLHRDSKFLAGDIVRGLDTAAEHVVGSE
jgi:hypothetical protein